MICQRCQNEATVHLTEPISGQRRELHLCRACARKAGLALPESPPNLALDAVVQSLIVANVGELVGELAELTCPDCGIKFMEFRAGGRLGCPQDYRVFSHGPARRCSSGIHGATRHVGKVGPAARGRRRAAAAPHPAARGDRPRRLRRSRAAARPAPPQGCPRMTLDDLTKSSGEWLRGTGPESDIVMCSRIRLARNLADFPFTNRASRGEKAEIEAHFSSALAHAKLELALPRRQRPARRSTASSWSSARSSPASWPTATARAASPSARWKTSRSWSTRKTISASSSCSRASGSPRSGTRSTSSTTSSRNSSPTPSAPSSAT